MERSEKRNSAGPKSAQVSPINPQLLKQGELFDFPANKCQPPNLINEDHHRQQFQEVVRRLSGIDQYLAGLTSGLGDVVRCAELLAERISRIEKRFNDLEALVQYSGEDSGEGN